VPIAEAIEHAIDHAIGHVIGQRIAHRPALRAARMGIREVDVSTGTKPGPGRDVDLERVVRGQDASEEILMLPEAFANALVFVLAAKLEDQARFMVDELVRKPERENALSLGRDLAALLREFPEMAGHPPDSGVPIGTPLDARMKDPERKKTFSEACKRMRAGLDEIIGMLDRDEVSALAYRLVADRHRPDLANAEDDRSRENRKSVIDIIKHAAIEVRKMWREESSPRAKAILRTAEKKRTTADVRTDALSILAPCGNDCSACPRFTATASGDPAHLAVVAELWHRLGWRDRVVSKEEISCRGCPPASPCRHDIVACVADRGVPSCAACGGKANCPRLDAALARTELAVDQCHAFVDAETYFALDRAFFRKRENLALSASDGCKRRA
jgi:hypothetical protein